MVLNMKVLESFKTMLLIGTFLKVIIIDGFP